jgi:hypothetical protein
LLLLLLLLAGVCVEQPSEPARGHSFVGLCSVWQQQQHQQLQLGATELAADFSALQLVFKRVAHWKGPEPPAGGHWHVFEGVCPGINMSVHC